MRVQAERWEETHSDRSSRAQFYDAWAYQIIFGTILGALIGWAARKLMRFSERHRLVDRESFVAQYVSLAIASMGVNVLLGSDDLLAAFACGTAFAWDGWFTRQTEDSNFSSIVDLLFNVATFIYIGALMPFGDFAGGSEAEPNTLNLWRLFVLAICVLLTKRLPIVVMLWRWIPDIKTFREAVFAGHFGPIGVGAIFIATLARTQLPEEVNSPPQTTNDILALTVQPIIFFFVLCSIIIHGLTIPFFAFSRRATTMTKTWSRNPSFMTGDHEPSWVNRFRKNKTGESLSPEEGNMTEIERVLNAQLGKIGRGAIGGDEEKELRRESSDLAGTGTEGDSNTAQGDDSDRSRIGLYNARTERGMLDNNDYEEDHALQKEDPMGEWGGDDTIEMKRYREKVQERKEKQYANLRREQQEQDERTKAETDDRQHDARDGDLGMGTVPADEELGPMDRDLKRSRLSEVDTLSQREREGMARWGTVTGADSANSQEAEHAAMDKERAAEDAYPRSKTWVEGSKLVIEYQRSKSSDCEVTVIPLMDEEIDSITSADDPAHAWAQMHATKIEHHLGLQDVAAWSPMEAANNLMHHRIPHLYNDYLAKRTKRRGSIVEAKEDRDRRSRLLFDSMSWASERREDSAEPPKVGKKKVKRPPTPEEEAPISGWLASPGGSQAKKQGRPSLANRRISNSSPSTSPNPASSGPAKQYVCRPSASDSRRLTLRKKLRAGELTLSKSSSFGEVADDDSDMELVDTTPTAAGHTPWPRSPRLSGFMPRSASAGGLGASTPGMVLSGRAMRPSKTASSELQIPRTRTVESTHSDKAETKQRGNRGHSKSSSIQWLDVNASQDHQPTRSSHRWPLHDKALDLARLGGGVTPRNGSRNPSPTRSRKNEDLQSTASNRHRHRISSLFSFAPSSSAKDQTSSRSADDSNDDDDDGRASTLKAPSSTAGEGGILGPPSRTGTTSNDSSNHTASQGVTFSL